MLCLYNENLTKFILTNSELVTLFQQYAISSLGSVYDKTVSFAYHYWQLVS